MQSIRTEVDNNPFKYDNPFKYRERVLKKHMVAYSLSQIPTELVKGKRSFMWSLFYRSLTMLVIMKIFHRNIKTSSITTYKNNDDGVLFLFFNQIYPKEDSQVTKT